MDAFDLQSIGHSHFLLSKSSLPFNNVIFTQTSACLSAQMSTRFVEHTSVESGLYQIDNLIIMLTHFNWIQSRLGDMTSKS